MNACSSLALRTTALSKAVRTRARGRTRPQWLFLLSAIGVLATVSPAWAQDAAEDEKSETAASSEAAEGEENGADAKAGGDPASGDEGAADKADDKDATLVADAEKGGSPVEEPGKTYLFVGARYRLIIVPSFMMRLFGDGGTTVSVHSFGPELGIRKDAFEYNIGLWYAAYGMDPTPFKGKDENEDAWELVESRIKVVYLTADFLWSHDFTPEFALNYGMGAGFGLVFGPLYRNQAYREPGGGYAPCVGPGNPNGFYCGGDNDHYNNYEEPSWGDGSKPIIMPWLAVQTGFRYKPHRNFAARFDAGFGLTGFFFGIGADYGL